MPLPFLDPLTAGSEHGPTVIAVLSEAPTVHGTDRHAHARGQLLGALEGLLSIATSASRLIVPAIHAIWLPPHHPHELLVHGPFRGWSLYIAESACATLPTEPQVIRVSGLLREASKRAALWNAKPIDDRQSHLAAVILDEIANAKSEPFSLQMPYDFRLGRIAKAFMTDLTDNRKLDDWAAWAAIPSRTLTRRFVLETGYSFSEWKQRVRLMRSLELLAEGTPVTTVALDVGYDNISAFIAVFRRTFGVTPAQYFTSAGRERTHAE